MKKKWQNTLKILRNLQDHGMTVLVTHDLTVADDKLYIRERMLQEEVEV